MGAYPRVATVTVEFPWGDKPCVMRLREGEMIDCPPGSALEAAIIAAGGNLRPATAQDEIGRGALSN